MNTIKLFLKGILLWVTSLSCVLFIASIDSLPLWLMGAWLTNNAALVYLCWTLISDKEAEKVSGLELLNKIL